MSAVPPAQDDPVECETPQGVEDGDERGQVALKGAWRADAEEDSHPEAKIEGAGVHEQALQQVLVSAHVCASQATGFIEMRTRSLELFAASGGEGVSRGCHGCVVDWHRPHRVRLLARSTTVARDRAR